MYKIFGHTGIFLCKNFMLQKQFVLSAFVISSSCSSFGSSVLKSDQTGHYFVHFMLFSVYVFTALLPLGIIKDNN